MFIFFYQIGKLIADEEIGKNMIPIVKLNEEQWLQISPHVIISSYGTEKTIFNSIDEIITADKVVTLNGRPMWKKDSATNSIAERIELYHIIFELPKGKFAVSSQVFNQELNIWNNKHLNIDKDQIKYYDIPTRKIYENKTLNYPHPEIIRSQLQRLLPLK